MATGYRWAERVKVNNLGEYLQRDSSAADYFRQNVATWWAINPQLTYMLTRCSRLSASWSRMSKHPCCSRSLKYHQERVHNICCT
uniref:RxLR effector candidate protein n=1 Tax=Hyaloperonospora arabidopsidis (strain Emoy2) TaxID=559515 RepID=M4B2R4_HYAAE